MEHTVTVQQTPTIFHEIVAGTADLLHESFRRLGYLNGSQDAPMPERNTVIHLVAALTRKGFATYAEASFPDEKEGRNRRLDILASDGVDTFAVEVKTFGKRDFERVLVDANRVRDFQPNICERIDGIPEMGFWDESRRWGCVVIQSFTQDAINELWKMQVVDPGGFEEALTEQIPQLLDSEKPGFQELAQFLQSVDATTGVEPVCSDIWDCNPLSLLWACFRLLDQGQG